MRKLKLQVQMSINGFIAGTNGEMDWMEWNWDEQLKQNIQEITDPVDCILLGRKLAEGFIPYWANVAADSSNPEQTAGKKFTETKKIVFSKTLEHSLWPNTTLSSGDLVDEINQLKRLPGGDIIAYGGSEFVSALIREDLVDEYNLLVNPTAIGKGMTIFSQLKEKLSLQLHSATAFPCGIVQLKYLKQSLS